MERERFQIKEIAPGNAFREPNPIANIITDLVKKAGLQADHQLNRLAEEWPAIVGAPVAAHTRPGEINGRILTVYVDSSVWLAELTRYGSRTMLANIRKALKSSEIRQLRFQIDPGHPG